MGFRIVLLHLYRDVVHGCLGLVKQHNLAGTVIGHLTHDFAADRTARTRDEHTWALDVFTHQRIVQHDGITAQQVLNLHLLDISRNAPLLIGFFLVLLKLCHPVHGKQCNIVLDKVVGKATVHQVVATRVKNQSIDVLAGEDFSHRGRIKLIDLEAVEFATLFARF